MCFQNSSLACKHKAVNQAASCECVPQSDTCKSAYAMCILKFCTLGLVVLQFMAKWLVFVTALRLLLVADLQCLHICAHCCSLVPNCCRIAIFGLAFLIATITQLQAAFTRNFHYDMKDDLPTWFMWILIVAGRLFTQFCIVWLQTYFAHLHRLMFSTKTCL